MTPEAFKEYRQSLINAKMAEAKKSGNFTKSPLMNTPAINPRIGSGGGGMDLPSDSPALKNKGVKASFQGRANPYSPSFQSAQIPKSFVSRLSSNIIPSTVELAGNIGQQGIGAIKGVGSTITGAQELVGQGLDVVTGQKQGTYQTPEFVKKGITPTNTNQKIGFAAEQLAEFLAPGSKILKIAEGIKGLKMLSKTPKLAKALGFTARALGEGLSAGTIQSLQSGKIDSESAKAARFGAAVPFVGGIAGETLGLGKKALFNLVIPSSGKQLLKDAATGLPIGEAVSKTGFSLTKKSLINKIRAISGNLGNKLGKEIDNAVATKPNETFAIEELTKDLSNKVKADKNIWGRIKASPIDEKGVVSVIDDVANQYNNLYKGKKLTYNDLQEIKLGISKGLQSEFDKAIGAAVKAKPAAELAVRKVVKETIEKGVSGAKKINQQLAPLLESLDRLSKKGGAGQKIVSTLGAGLYSAAQGVSDPSQRNVTDVAKNMLTGALITRGMGTVAARTAAGTILKYLEKISSNPAAMQGVRKITNPALEETVPQ